MSREWAAPIRDDALRMTIVSDPHFGRRVFTDDAMRHAGASLDLEVRRTDIFANLGDSIHWRLAEHKDPNDASAKAWLAARAAATPKPWYTIGGNHDLASYGAPYPIRSGDQWAADLGVGPRNRVVDWQDWCRLIFVTPIYQGFDADKPGHLPMELNASEIEWIRVRATETDRRALVFFHAPIPAHYSSHMRYAEPLEQMIGDTPQIAAWISGHRHVDLGTDSRCAMNLAVGGRTIHALNVPSFGGATPPWPDDRWGQPFLSTHLSVLPEGGMEVRFRDHMQSRWVPWAKTGMVTYLPPL